MFWRFSAAYLAPLAALVLAGVPAAAGEAVKQPPAWEKPIAPETQAFLDKKALITGAPVYFRIFKEESELEVWKARPGGRFLPIKTYPICNWSGALGPKQTLGDRMAPEGFYDLKRDSLKPDSKYHLALNVGYPNALDRALGRSGDFIMVHGSCVSIGCFAMTDEFIEEIYAFARQAFDGGEARIPLHIFPFRMTAENLARHKGHAAEASWAPLQEAYDDFKTSQLVPRIAMCEKRYVVNPVWQQGEATADTAAAACPAAPGKLVAPLSRRLAKKLLSTPLMALGAKTRTLESIENFDPAAVAAEAAKKDEDRKRKEAEAERQAGTGGFSQLLQR